MFFSKSLIAGILPLFYGFWTLSTIYHAVHTKNFNLFRSSQVFFIILLPFLVQLSLGGFAQSGSVVLLSSISPFAALVFFNVKTSRIWFAAFIAVLAASYFLDEIVIAFYNNNFGTAFIKVMYFMNAFCIGFIIDANGDTIQQGNMNLFGAINLDTSWYNYSINSAMSPSYPLTMCFVYVVSIGGSVIDTCILTYNSVPTAIADINVSSNRKLISIFDVLGRQNKGTKNELLFYIYDDGTVEKKIIIE